MPHTNCFPITTERGVVGVLELRTAAALEAPDRAMVATVVRLYGNFHGLLDHSERDALTGLLNRQTFQAALIAPEPRPRDAGEDGAGPGRRTHDGETSVWLGVVDIDFFKRINDGFGHLIGDEVLLLLSRLMRATFRHRDRLYRIGGEEFAVVIECTGADQATGAFERLRQAVERYAFPQVGNVTVSIGITRATRDDGPSGAFGRADRALYHVKQTGRNRVAQHEDLVRGGQLAAPDIVGDIELF